MSVGGQDDVNANTNINATHYRGRRRNANTISRTCEGEDAAIFRAEMTWGTRTHADRMRKPKTAIGLCGNLDWCAPATSEVHMVHQKRNARGHALLKKRPVQCWLSPLDRSECWKHAPICYGNAPQKALKSGSAGFLNEAARAPGPAQLFKNPEWMPPPPACITGYDGANNRDIAGILM